jgi:hypothetical protein
VPIEAGKTNVVTIELSTLALQWDTQSGQTLGTGTSSINDFLFSATGSTLTIKDRYIALSKPTGDTETLSVEFNVGKLQPLINADVSNSNLTIAKHTVLLKAAYPETQDFNYNVTLAPTNVEGTGPYKYSTTSVTFKNDTATDKLPQMDVYAYLVFELEYRAFGTEDSGGTTWIIRNGLTRSTDDSPDGTTGKSATAGGSLFVVKIGNPTGPFPTLVPTP